MPLAADSMVVQKAVLVLALVQSVKVSNPSSYLSCFNHEKESRGEGGVFKKVKEARLRENLERWFSKILAEDFPFSKKG